ncbi:hypothetical protein NUSPORA_00783 [Nucleospora cyclopteri]
MISQKCNDQKIICRTSNELQQLYKNGTNLSQISRIEIEEGQIEDKNALLLYYCHQIKTVGPKAKDESTLKLKILNLFGDLLNVNKYDYKLLEYITFDTIIVEKFITNNIFDKNRITYTISRLYKKLIGAYINILFKYDLKIDLKNTMNMEIDLNTIEYKKEIFDHYIKYDCFVTAVIRNLGRRNSLSEIENEFIEIFKNKRGDIYFYYKKYSKDDENLFEGKSNKYWWFLNFNNQFTSVEKYIKIYGYNKIIEILLEEQIDQILAEIDFEENKGISESLLKNIIRNGTCKNKVLNFMLEKQKESFNRTNKYIKFIGENIEEFKENEDLYSILSLKKTKIDIIIPFINTGINSYLIDYCRKFGGNENINLIENDVDNWNKNFYCSLTVKLFEKNTVKEDLIILLAQIFIVDYFSESVFNKVILDQNNRKIFNLLIENIKKRNILQSLYAYTNKHTEYKIEAINLLEKISSENRIILMNKTDKSHSFDQYKYNLNILKYLFEFQKTEISPKELLNRHLKGAESIIEVLYAISKIFPFDISKVYFINFYYQAVLELEKHSESNTLNLISNFTVFDLAVENGNDGFFYQMALFVFHYHFSCKYTLFILSNQIINCRNSNPIKFLTFKTCFDFVKLKKVDYLNFLIVEMKNTNKFVSKAAKTALKQILQGEKLQGTQTEPIVRIFNDLSDKNKLNEFLSDFIEHTFYNYLSFEYLNALISILFLEINDLSLIILLNLHNLISITDIKMISALIIEQSNNYVLKYPFKNEGLSNTIAIYVKECDLKEIDKWPSFVKLFENIKEERISKYLVNLLKVKNDQKVTKNVLEAVFNLKKANFNDFVPFISIAIDLQEFDIQVLNKFVEFSLKSILNLENRFHVAVLSKMYQQNLKRREIDQFILQNITNSNLNSNYFSNFIEITDNSVILFLLKYHNNSVIRKKSHDKYKNIVYNRNSEIKKTFKEILTWVDLESNVIDFREILKDFINKYPLQLEEFLKTTDNDVINVSGFLLSISNKFNNFIKEIAVEKDNFKLIFNCYNKDKRIISEIKDIDQIILKNMQGVDSLKYSDLIMDVYTTTKNTELLKFISTENMLKLLKKEFNLILFIDPCKQLEESVINLDLHKQYIFKLHSICCKNQHFQISKYDFGKLQVVFNNCIKEVDNEIFEIIKNYPKYLTKNISYLRKYYDQLLTMSIQNDNNYMIVTEIICDVRECNDVDVCCYLLRNLIDPFKRDEVERCLKYIKLIGEFYIQQLVNKYK